MKTTVRRPRWCNGYRVCHRTQIRGLKPGRGRWISKGTNVCSTISFGEKVKLAIPCRQILRHVKDQNEVVLRICIAIKNTSSSAGFEPWVQWQAR
jgi:hypothetical protein